ncbi:hypothetical protein N7519_008724 [Penicillium mononematosum]|uniref:uncharacterized protein n=1 Tax=Penicillium mononematosum TaxID=268346 RepID=UPI00254787C0|nr:uncharacterized protein N7519_008724 [Penicillium mononematosum]KAJ6178263.1 hypothetical protein N7519_008724 [Penicillium mononematosum]
MEAVYSMRSAELSSVSLHGISKYLTIATCHCPATIVRSPDGSFPKTNGIGFTDFSLCCNRILNHLNWFAQPSPELKRSSTVLVAYLTKFGLSLSHRAMWLLLNCPNTKLRAARFLPLLTDSSATQCSPGFRVLAQVLSSNCWKMTWAHREKWPSYMPSEVLLGILRSLEPRDALSFAQASFEAERWYYASVPQFTDVSVQSLDLSIPCCGDRTGLEDSGVHCTRCRTWQHQMCIGLETLPFNDSFTCAVCLEKNPKATRLTAGGINRLGGRAERRMCAIKIDGSAKSLRVRLSQPAHLRPDLRLIGDLIHNVPKGHIDFTIRFNGVFAGLAYGVEPDLMSLDTGLGSGRGCSS